ncbi:MAG TPA: YceD family protein [Methylotenera sp.]|nr:YceD family protein [Methylotenera sp.]HPH04432.1 YceD family protein [Methylotenera sp.]HPN01554.1 YceD family protein [Methylotenera sp.]
MENMGYIDVGYSRASPSSLRIDNVAFAQKGERMSGALNLLECPRLKASLPVAGNATDAETVHYVLQGSTDASAQRFISLSISCNFSVICQRCLSLMPLKLHLNFKYLIVSDIDSADADALDVDDEVDCQQASKEMDIVQLIEDEILMAMPIAPTHAHDCAKLVMQSGEKPNPFAVLKGLIKDKNTP